MGVAELIKAVAAVLWPLLVLFIVLTFRHTFNRILDSMERREIEIDVGGQKLTLRQLNDQQSKLITDLQRQVATLSKARAAGPEPEPTHPAPEGTEPTRPEPTEIESPAGPVTEVPAPTGVPAPEAPVGSTAPPIDRHTTPQPLAVLWVDDHPENSALVVEQLQDNGVRVDIARTTNEALDRLSHRQYRLIISDMARMEGASYDPSAGVALIRELRDIGVETPVVIYCSQPSRLRSGSAAREAGAIAVTDSSLLLFEQLQTFELL